MLCLVVLKWQLRAAVERRSESPAWQHARTRNPRAAADELGCQGAGEHGVVGACQRQKLRAGEKLDADHRYSKCSPLLHGDSAGGWVLRRRAATHCQPVALRHCYELEEHGGRSVKPHHLAEEQNAAGAVTRCESGLGAAVAPRGHRPRTLDREGTLAAHLLPKASRVTMDQLVCIEYMSRCPCVQRGSARWVRTHYRLFPPPNIQADAPPTPRTRCTQTRALEPSPRRHYRSGACVAEELSACLS